MNLIKEAIDDIRGTLDLFDEGYEYDEDFEADIDASLSIIEDEAKDKDRKLFIISEMIDKCNHTNWKDIITDIKEILK